MARTKQRARNSPSVSLPSRGGSVTTKDSCKIFCTRSKAYSIGTSQKHQRLFVACYQNNRPVVQVFHRESGELLQTFDSLEGYEILTGITVGNGDDWLCIPAANHKGSGVLCLSLPNLELARAFLLEDSTFQIRPRCIRFYDKTTPTTQQQQRALVAADANRQWCTWDVASGTPLRMVDKTAQLHHFCPATAGAGPWQFWTWSSVTNLETGREYALFDEEEQWGISQDCNDMDAVLKDGSNSCCRLFVAYDRDTDCGVLEMEVDFAGATSQGDNDKRPTPQKPNYTLLRRIAMPENGPHGYRGASGIQLLRLPGNNNELLYVNCSLFAFTVHLTDNPVAGAYHLLWSARHAAGDANEAWDNGTVHADAQGRCYVTTATNDERFAALGQNGVCCVKQFTFPLPSGVALAAKEEETNPSSPNKKAKPGG